MKINNSDSIAFAHTNSDNKMEKIDYSNTNYQQMTANSNNNHSNIDLQAVLANANSQFMPKCPLCDKTFANSSNLKHHMNTIHFNEAKWICNECGKVCTSKSNLKVHLRVHLRVKPYYCRWCDYNCMHHSSIRDHLSKCHPEKSHNSCEPGYIFNSTAVPEPELSHFEPSAVLLSNNHDYDETNQTDHKMNNSNKKPIITKIKRSLEDDYMNNNDQEQNDLSHNIKSEDQINERKSNMKKFKQDMEIDFNNKLLKKKKYLKKHRIRQQITNGYDLQQKMASGEDDEPEEDSSEINFDNNHTNEEHFNDDDDLNRNNYYSDNDDKDIIKNDDDEDDEHHNDNEIDSNHRQSTNLDDESLFLVPNKFNNSNSNQTLASTSSTSSTVSSSNSINYSGTESKSYLKTPMSMNNFPFTSHNILQQQINQNELFSALLSGLPLDNNNYNNESKSSNFNNLAAMLIQRLSTVAFMQQLNNKNNETNTSLLTNNSDNEQFNGLDKNQMEQFKLITNNGNKIEKNSNEHTRNCALDLSVKQNVKKQKLDEVDNDEYTSALSPISTSSTHLSNSSIKSSKSSSVNNDYQKNKVNISSNDQLKHKNDKDLPNNQINGKKPSNKAILDVINRLNSNLPKINKPDETNKQEQKIQKVKNTELFDCDNTIANENCTKEEHNNNLEELNDLIKSHLLPLSEAALEKYRDFFHKKNKDSAINHDACSKTSETTNESVVSSISSSPLSSSSPSSSFSSDYKCTFCNILKNLLDLHQFLHKI